MGVITTGGFASVITATFFSASGWFKTDPNSPEFYSHLEITPNGGLFSDWAIDENGNEVNECRFWNASHFYAPRTCDTFGISRISMSSGTRAIDRAIKCAASFDTQCILSGEIGFSAPAAFLYDSQHGFRMVLAPRFVDTNEYATTTSETKLVRLQDPTGHGQNTLMRFNASVVVEYIQPGSRAVVTEEMTGSDAYCIQTLRVSVSPACWIELD